MQSSLIGKIQKAKRYAEEPERVTFSQFKLTFHGAHKDHNVDYYNGELRCNCGFFLSWNTCSHTMALERMLSLMMPRLQPVVANI